MNVSLSKIVLLFSLAFVFFLTSCGDDNPEDVSGCTDARAENYNANATTDNGSCVFPNEKFLGNYMGSFSCAGLFSVIDQDTVEFEITEAVNTEEKSKVTKLRLRAIMLFRLRCADSSAVGAPPAASPGA